MLEAGDFFVLQTGHYVGVPLFALGRVLARRPVTTTGTFAIDARLISPKIPGRCSFWEAECKKITGVQALGILIKSHVLKPPVVL